MTKGILGKKVGMTQIFTEQGELIPVTVIDVNTNVVLQLKSEENEGYNAVQLGLGDKREVLSNKVMLQQQKRLLSASFVKFVMQN